MVRVQILKPDGRIVGNRLARAGDVLEVDHLDARDLVESRSAVVLLRIEITKPSVIIGTRIHSLGDVVEVIEPIAERHLLDGSAVLAPLRATRNVDQGSTGFRPGQEVKIGTAQEASRLIAQGQIEHFEAVRTAAPAVTSRTAKGAPR